MFDVQPSHSVTLSRIGYNNQDHSVDNQFWVIDHQADSQMQADAFAGFNKLYESGTIQQAACMAHIQRNFFDLTEDARLAHRHRRCSTIAALYLIEKQVKGRPADERHAIRIARAKPLFIP
jgi:transposase IS66 family protein